MKVVNKPRCERFVVDAVSSLYTWVYYPKSLSACAALIVSQGLGMPV